ncbi:hypothetical protein XA68_12842 [Ophiocordyceps unilateralis]|uniref:Fucose-specific lectin n=1 Tax=Ophiocordyceps unilateralis TaxID=268505 RepID=A0A2A9PNY3_OPHUN|nr:hypothetical protein XA68_12842 [Ophiocordyceps unilateralis]
MPLDIPLLLRRQQNMSSPPFISPTTSSTGKGLPDHPEIIHNHYYTTRPNIVPWYRRKRFIWTAAAVIVFFVVASAVTLGVVLKLEVGKGRFRSSGNTPSPSTLVSQVVSTSQSTAPTPTSGKPPDALTSATGALSSQTKPSSSSTLKSVTAAETPLVIFTVSEKSRLASVYLENEQEKLHRRLLVWQDDNSDLIVTEWSVDNKSRYRLRDKLSSTMPDAKLGSPLAMTASSSGAVHLFFLDTQNAVSHVFQPAAGVWERSALSKSNGPVVASGPSPLSTAWHRTKDGIEVLGLAYANSQELRLVMTDGPTADSPWLAVKVTSLPGPVPGQSEEPCFALAGDWRNAYGARTMLLAILVEDGLFAFECQIETWPPGSTTPCRKINDTFQDEKSRDVAFAPPPKQLDWIRLDSGHSAPYDFSLVSLGEDGFVSENRIGANVARKTERGLDTKMAVRAISATDEAVLFAASSDDIYAYRLDEDSGSWRAEGPLLVQARDRLE